MTSALLLIDIQGDYLSLPGLQPPSDVLIARATTLLHGCRSRGIPIIHVWTTIYRDNDRRLPHWKSRGQWLCVEGTAGHRPPESLRPINLETIVHKCGFNAFSSTDLESILKRNGCKMVILAGVHLHACVRTAAVECLERGFQVTIAEDAVATNDPVHAASSRRWLAERCVSFQTSATVLSYLDGRGPAAFVHRSPREIERVLFEIVAANEREVTTAAEEANSAWKQWRKVPRSSRLQLLGNIAAQLEAKMPVLVRQMAIEIGKPVSHAREEIFRAVRNVRDVISRAATFQEFAREGEGGVRYESLGPIAIVSPWNNPVAIPLGKIVPALAYGNTVLWKPAPQATQLSRAILQILSAAGIPSGCVCLLAGVDETARLVANHEMVRAVTITGSIAAGNSAQEICVRRSIPLQAELNGNNAAIVWDTDLDYAAGHIARGAFAFAGQRCTANRRVIVENRHLQQFIETVNFAASGLVWGDPLDSTTDIGPVINQARFNEHEALLEQAKACGSERDIRLPFEGRLREPWLKNGAYAQPAIVKCDNGDHPLVQAETMSPLLVVQGAEDFDHAMALCNGVPQGLVAALFSNSRELQGRFIQEADAGIIKFNTSTAGADPTMPFIGRKASGIGAPEHGEADRLFYTRMQAVYGFADLP